MGLRSAASIVVLSGAVIAAGCAGLAGTRSGAPQPSDPPAPSSPTAARAPADWAAMTLTNVRDGSSFRILDFKGRPVFIETMAIWCGNCRAQQALAKKALPRLPADVAYLVLDVEQSESPESLRRYAEEFDFPFIYAVAPAELSRALARDFGDSILNPVATPIIHIGRDGRVTRTPDGYKSAEDLVRLAGG